MKGFFPSWTASTWIFNFSLIANLAPHLSHWIFDPSWIEKRWIFKLCLYAKQAPQLSHLNSFFPSWTASACLFKLCFDARLALHLSHWKFLLSRIEEMWTLKLPFCVKQALHMSHLKFLFFHEPKICDFSSYFLCKANITYVKYEWFLSFMNRFNLSFQILRQTYHGKCHILFSFLHDLKKCEYLS